MTLDRATHRIIRRAERILRKACPEPYRDWPFRVALRHELPEDCQLKPGAWHCLGFTGSWLCIALADVLGERYRKPGFAMVLDIKSIKSFCAEHQIPYELQILVTVWHEALHQIVGGHGDAFMSPAPAHRMEKGWGRATLKDAAEYQSQMIAAPLPSEGDFGHDAAFIRACIHLSDRIYDACHRLNIFAELIALRSIPWSCTRTLLDERRARRKDPLHDILTSPVPQAFEDAWKQHLRSLIEPECVTSAQTTTNVVKGTEMSIMSVIESLFAKRQAAEQTADECYNQLIDAGVSGQTLSQQAVEDALAKSGRTVEQLKADVELALKRKDWEAIARLGEQATEELATIENTKSELCLQCDAEHAAADEKLQASLQPLVERTHVLRNQQLAGTTAAGELRRTALPERHSAVSEKQAVLRRLSNEYSRLQQEKVEAECQLSSGQSKLGNRYQNVKDEGKAQVQTASKELERLRVAIPEKAKEIELAREAIETESKLLLVA